MAFAGHFAAQRVVRWTVLLLLAAAISWEAWSALHPVRLYHEGCIHGATSRYSEPEAPPMLLVPHRFWPDDEPQVDIVPAHSGR